ncbi:MAG: hypothetical protein J1E00_00570 [Oscillospiraceae bacterium]|nr:hypothetical protein [Oscillospiraceae bacterium]
MQRNEFGRKLKIFIKTIDKYVFCVYTEKKKIYKERERFYKKKDLFIRIFGTYMLSEKALEAADVSHDGKVNAIDYLYVNRFVLGTLYFPPYYVD